MSKKPERLAVAELFEQRLKNRWRKAPFVLRLTEWAEYPGTVVIIKERLERYAQIRNQRGND